MTNGTSPNYKVDERNNRIHPSAVIDDDVELGEDNYIGPFCYLTGYLTIGDNNRFEAYCSVGTRPEGVTLSCNAIMLGHVHVMKHSNCGTGSEVHQYQVVGSYSMIGMGCIVPKKSRLEPGQTWVGNPARRLKTNMFALEKSNVDEYDLIEETARYTQLRQLHGF